MGCPNQVWRLDLLRLLIGFFVLFVWSGTAWSAPPQEIKIGYLYQPLSRIKISLMDIPAAREAGPEERVIEDERQSRLWGHVQALPERCRQLLGVIAYADKPDYAALAEALGMPVGSIGPTRGRCLAKLRDALGKDVAWENPREGHLS